MLWIFLLAVLGLGMGFWLFASRRLFQNMEEASYTLIERRKTYELRDYEPFIGSEVRLPGDILSTSNQGFGILNQYFFTPETVPPLDALERRAEKGGESFHTVICARPKAVGGDIPSSGDHAHVKTMLYPGRVVAARSFSWYPTERRIVRLASLLGSELLRDGFTVVGEPELVLYNAPFSPPFFMRSEVLMAVEG